MSALAERIAVALIAKAPVPGKVKTRFVPPFTFDEAAMLARAFIDDTSQLVTSAQFGDLFDCWCSYLGDAPLLRELLPASVQMVEQRGTGFDQRLANTAEDLFAMGYGGVILLGADCPTVDAGYLAATVDAMRSHELVLGPADDGGYVLIGMNRADSSLFEGIEMGTEFVLAQTLYRANKAGYKVEVLPSLHDLDTVVELREAIDAGQLVHAAATSALLNQPDWGAKI